MGKVVFGDSAWSDTFPHIVTPYPDEWLGSLLLRCDEVNHWKSGETFRYLLRLTNPPGFSPRSSLIVVPFSFLECFAQFLMLSPQCLLATTYSAELARLYPFDEPHPGQLLGMQYNPENWSWRRRLGQREIATERKIHLCPACIAEKRTIRRITTLPHMRYCPTHLIAFQGHCTCGHPLMFFFKYRPPFKCYACGLDWARWPQIPIPPDRVALERDLSALYEFFLLKGTGELRVQSLRLARRYMREHESFELKLTGKRIKHPATYGLYRLSLGYVVDILVSVGISLNDIANSDIP
jgi:hypothetical protein